MLCAVLSMWQTHSDSARSYFALVLLSCPKSWTPKSLLMSLSWVSSSACSWCSSREHRPTSALFIFPFTLHDTAACSYFFFLYPALFQLLSFLVLSWTFSKIFCSKWHVTRKTTKLVSDTEWGSKKQKKRYAFFLLVSLSSVMASRSVMLKIIFHFYQFPFLN